MGDIYTNLVSLCIWGKIYFYFWFSDFALKLSLLALIRAEKIINFYSNRHKEDKMPGFIVVGLPAPAKEANSHGLVLSFTEQEILQHSNVAGVILFTRNFANPDQLKQLTSAIHRLNPNLFICVDQEGGYVQRFQRQGFRALPAARFLGEIYDTNAEVGLAMAQQVGRELAKDLSEHGIDFPLGPVLDLHGNNKVIGGLDRAFHAQTEVVVQLGKSYIQGLQEYNMLNVAKHFPGHGTAQADSHLEKTLDETPADLFLSEQEAAFMNLLSDLDAVMFSHVIYSNLDNEPAGYSTFWHQRLDSVVASQANDHTLRHEIFWKNVLETLNQFPSQGLEIEECLELEDAKTELARLYILDSILHENKKLGPVRFTDCLAMKGAELAGGMQANISAALKARCDLVLVCNEPLDTLRDIVNNAANKSSAASQSRVTSLQYKAQATRILAKLRNSNEATLARVKEPKETKERKELKETHAKSSAVAPIYTLRATQRQGQQNCAKIALQRASEGLYWAYSTASGAVAELPGTIYRQWTRKKAHTQ